MNKKNTSSNDLAVNRRASYDYEILETYEAGISLLGTEVKSLRDSGGNLQEAYVRVMDDEIWLIGASIAPYKFGGQLFNHEERRDRKLLMHKREILRLKEGVKLKGLTLIPLALYLKSGKVKLKIALGRGKKRHDKREALISREKQREVERATRHFT